MEKRILSYRRYMDDLLCGDDSSVDWQQVREQHLIQVGFFQHERLIHLIVTVLFALLEVISIALFTIVCNLPEAAGASIPGLVALCGILLVLLIPYVRHYFILENEVQKMYKQYDAVCKRCGYQHIFFDNH